MGEEKKLSSKTLKKVFNRHYQLLGCFNYERQMSTGYAWTMMPALKELYKDNPEEMKSAVKRHLDFTIARPLQARSSLAFPAQWKSKMPVRNRGNMIRHPLHRLRLL